MKTIRNFIIITTYALVSYTAFTISSDAPKNIIIAIPGILGDETHRGYSETVLDLSPENSIIHRMGTVPLQDRPDLGHKRCVEHLEKNFYKNASQRGVVVVATSQGTSTATKFIRQTGHQWTNAFIAEGYAASFNECIIHTAENLVPFTKYIPFKRDWLPFLVPYIPYFEGTFFPLWHYDPTQYQAIDVLRKLHKKFPIIIIHCKQDRLTPYTGALAAYYALRQNKNHADNTYLISIDKNSLDPYDFDDGHINNSLSENAKALIKHVAYKIDIENSDEIKKEFQPDATPWQCHADAIRINKHRIRKVNLLLNCSKYCILFLIIIYSLSRFKK